MKNILLLISFIFTYSNSFSQTEILIKSIHPNSVLTFDVNGNWIFNESNINSLFNSYNIDNIGLSFPNVINFDHPSVEELLLYYSVTVNDSLVVGLYSDLLNNFSTFFDEITILEEGNLIGASCPTNDPKEQVWNLTRHEIMNVREAWCFTQGDPTVKISIFDSGYEVDHVDLASKVDYVEPGLAHSSACHGTYVAGAAACATNNSIGLSSSGFKSRLLLYGYGTQPNTLNRMFDAFNKGARVANLSLCWCSPLDPVQDGISMLADMGMIIVAAAGNGNYGRSCGNGHGDCYPASYNNVISISGVTAYEGRSGEKCFENTFGCSSVTPQYSTQNDNVDFVAQSFSVDLLDCDDSNNNGIYDDYLSGCGTSFASPQIAGVIALLLSVNPCLSHDDVMNILSITESDISGDCNNQDYYPNSSVPGIPNAEDAVIMAQDYGFQDYVIGPGTTIWNNAEIYAGKITVLTGGQLIISNDSKVTMIHETGNIVVQRGAKLVVDHSIVTACKKWDGIYVEGNASLVQPDYQVMPSANEAGIVYLTNAAVLENAKTAISTTKYNEHWNSEYWGGLVVGENSGFYDNDRAVEFMKYNLPNKSSFINCEFKELNDAVDWSVGVTIWSTDDILFEECRFERLDGVCLTVYDAGVEVTKQNLFKDSYMGIEVYTTYPFTSSINIGVKGAIGNDRNYFKGNLLRNIFSIAVDEQLNRAGINIMSNDFDGGQESIILYGPTKHEIFDNSFFSHEVGIFGLETNEYSNQVECNDFAVTDLGIVYAGMNLATHFWKNMFDCPEDMYFTSWQNLGEIYRRQGSGEGAANCFTNGTPDIYASPTETKRFVYCYKDENGLLCHKKPINNLSDGGTNNYTLEEKNIEVDCSNGLGGGLGGDSCTYDFQDWTSVLAQIEQINNDLMNDPMNEILLTQLAEAKWEKSIILSCLLKDAVISEDLPLAYQLLDDEGSTHSQRVKYGIMLNNEDYTGALVQLASLPNSTQEDLYFNQVQQINISRLMSTGEYSLSQSDEDLLTTIGLSKTVSSAYARSLLTLLTGVRLPLIIPKPTNGGENLLTMENFIKENNFKILKNPVQENLSISVLNELETDLVVHLIDANGYVVKQKSIHPSSVQVIMNIVDLSNGMYIVRITDSSNKVVYISKVIKQ